MNRLIKLILYITAGCIGIGCAALILGFALGGTKDVWQLKDELMSGRFKYAAESLADRVRNRAGDGSEVTEGSGFEYAYAEEYDEDDICGDTYDVYGDTYTEETVTDYGQEQILCIESSAIEDIRAELRHANLFVEESEDSRIQVMVAGAVKDVQAKVNAGKLVISDERKGKKGRRDISVYLYLPEDTSFHSITIENDAGVVESECELQAGSFSIQSGAAQMVLSDITAEVFSVKAGTGAIDIQDGIFGSVQLECGVGQISVDADIKGSAQIDCGMGAVEVNLDDDADSVNYLLKCGAGEIVIDGVSYRGFSKEKRIDNNGASELFTLNCGMGQIIIE